MFDMDYFIGCMVGFAIVVIIHIIKAYFDNKL